MRTEALQLLCEVREPGEKSVTSLLLAAQHRLRPRQTCQEVVVRLCVNRPAKTSATRLVNITVLNLPLPEAQIVVEPQDCH